MGQEPSSASCEGERQAYQTALQLYEIALQQYQRTYGRGETGGKAGGLLAASQKLKALEDDRDAKRKKLNECLEKLDNL
jgi:hypothetical protein